jgi:hypothetical protein
LTRSSNYQDNKRSPTCLMSAPHAKQTFLRSQYNTGINSNNLSYTYVVTFVDKEHVNFACIRKETSLAQESNSAPKLHAGRFAKPAIGSSSCITHMKNTYMRLNNRTLTIKRHRLVLRRHWIYLPRNKTITKRSRQTINS